MRLGAIAFLAGILLLHTLPELPARSWALALPVVVLALIFVPRVRLPAWGIAGFLWAMLLAAPPSALPAELEGVELWVEGWIVAIPDREPRSIRFEFETLRAQRGDQPVPLTGRLRLSWWDDNERSKDSSASRPELRVGDRWGFMVRLKRPHSLLNPGSFDYERWLYAKGIVATGNIRAHPPPQRLGQAERYPLDRYRQRVVDAFHRLLPGNPYAGILVALAVGDESGITPWQWELLNRVGVGHLMSISGSHIGLVAGIVFGLIWLGWSWSPKLALRWPATRAAALGTILGAGGYTLLSGLSVPAQRSFLMAAVAMTALLLQRPVVPSRILALALLAVLISDPEAPLMAGFWLSFGAVAAILYSVSGRWREGRLFGQTVGLQLNITLAMLPPTLVFFQQFPLWAALANLIAIPWVDCTVLPLSLLAALSGPLGDPVQTALLELAALTLDGLWQIMVWLDRWPGMVLYRPAPPLWTLIFALPGMALLLAPKGLPGRWLGLPLCLPLLWPPAVGPKPGGFWFTFLDAGSGPAAVVQTRHHILVYDTGPKLGTTLDAGRAVVVPFLRRQGATQVDLLIISHADGQHTGGVRSLRELMPVARMLTSAPEQTPIDGAEPCRAGQAWEWDGVRFEILHPPERGFSDDNASCVLRVEGAAGRVLLTGDIEGGAEAALAASQGTGLAAEILVAPHHGHRNLSTPAFLNAVQPRYILLATGYRNRFGYPRPDTLARYQATGATVLDPVEEGALTFRVEPGRALEPERYRRDQRRYWNAP
ncbi:MAG: DNA internalization-related competence protein ComEC/Rec2 [Candidatus Contendobacter sp.]|jgi:competence protein ComEC|nr:DNA internalization-related competence protein ComEC/Rec2 [Gammaproteobacteria bacterium]MCC8992221.1 DNA internalization-related competence protein ComEC/Rec2 [Candidatus Contendobacter sp.]